MSGIEARKADHVRLALAAGDGAASNAFGAITLVHNALPEIDRAAIDSSATFLGRRLAIPLVIASMTGGHPDGARINRDLAIAASRLGIAMGVGSQRAALVDPGLRSTYTAAREAAPDAILYANVGAPQLVEQDGRAALDADEVRSLVGMIAADALIIHLNAVQESVQPGGDRDARGWTDAIRRLVDVLDVPVIVKETGGGVSESVARRIAATGAAAIDVGGSGGTSFAAIEAIRAADAGDPAGAALGTALAGWGIPTPVTVILAARAGLPVVATGGVRSGIDAAKAIALGATLVGVARPILEAVLAGGPDAAVAWVERFAAELATVQFLTGAPDLVALGGAPVVLGPDVRAWLAARPIREEDR